MVEISDKEKCCGCSACTNICPKQCISMEYDEEGFVYPIIDKDICISCSLCDTVCPIVNPVKTEEMEQEGYVVQNKDKKILRESTSGGAFTAIAKYVLRKGGIVYGAAMDDDFNVFHIGVETERELVQFRSSKYVQSTIFPGTFMQIRKYLEAGRNVCFSGTPCQVEGLLHFLGKDYDELVLVDFSCRAVPSPMIFHKYLEYMNHRFENRVTKVRFRSKYYGYMYSTMELSTGKTAKYHHGTESDQWLRAFFSNICDRPSCYACEFKQRYRRSDFTIWDCFSARKFAKEIDDNKGATRLLIHTAKGKNIFKSIQDDFRYKKIGADDLLKNCREIYYSVPINEKREAFMKDAVKLNSVQLFDKYFPDNLISKLKHLARVFLVKVELYSFIRVKYNEIKNIKGLRRTDAGRVL